MPDAAELLVLAVEIVREAGETARRMRVEGVSGIATKSTDTDVVTAADRAVERQVVDVLRVRRPRDVVLGEEYGASGARGEVRWILDPIDGTVNYLYDLPQYAVSLAAEVEGRVVAGVVRNPATGVEWTATLGVAPSGTASGCTARRRPSSPRRWSAPGSGTTRPAACTRPACCTACSGTCGTSGASARPRSTCARRRAGSSTRTTRRG
ncbi:hypothetical protein Phou_019320 [Phytohabitans houttuyneae]|uniref:Inositol monophosphatase n=1 Tax=Phytohabitans houttuyneae TaxID=1076126 RepID=A0A6V8JYD4_9ACTN|nr:hypothetical protein Phou_019320 [Phytohabitans houttuyneae]